MTIKIALKSLGQMLEQRLGENHPIKADELLVLKKLHRATIEGEATANSRLKRAKEVVARRLSVSLSFSSETAPNVLAEALVDEFRRVCKHSFMREFMKFPSLAELLEKPARFDSRVMNAKIARLLVHRGVSKGNANTLALTLVRMI